MSVRNAVCLVGAVKWYDVVFKAVEMAALVALSYSATLPWILENGMSMLDMSPGRGFGTQYWSYKYVSTVFGDHLESVRVRSEGLLEYWQLASVGGSVWFVIFVMQVAAAVLLAVSVFREKVKGHSYPVAGAVSAWFIALTLGFFQFNRLSMTEGYGPYSVSFEMGYVLALLSFVVFWAIVSLSLFMRTRASWHKKPPA